jgi:Zn-dependent M28 family amino/carboxypeptidase
MGLQAHIEIPLAEPQGVDAVNVLGLLPGSDPVLGKRLVILGAHYDHVGDDPGAGTVLCEDVGCQPSPGRHYAGANDNASGVGVLLEIARLWHEAGYRPRHSVLFAAWGGQEPGELGSRYYVQHPVYPLEYTVAALQLDAVGGGEGYFLEAQGEPERDGLLRFSFVVAEEWLDGRLTLRQPSDRGDHVPFHQAGVPALLLTWRGASEENWPTELADEVQPYRLGVTGRMTALAAMSIAQ